MKKTSHFTKFRRTLMLEGLEIRALLAGNVTASVVEGVLQITGDDAPNGVLIRQVPQTQTAGTEWTGAKFEIKGAPTGHATAATPTTINGLEKVVVEGVKLGVNIELGKGNDRLHIANPPPPKPTDGSTPPPAPAPQVNLPGRVGISLGEGNDEAILYFVNKGSAAVNLGIGNDAVQINGSSVNELIVNGDPPPPTTPPTTPPPANDRIALAGLIASGPVTVNTGIGDDGVNIVGGKTALAKGITIETGLGNDGVQINGDPPRDGKPPVPAKLGPTVRIDTGAGNDRVGIGAAQGGNVGIATGEGNDEVRLDNFAAEVLSVLLAAGDDKLGIGKSKVGKTTLAGGEGTDLFAKGAAAELGTLVVEGFEAPPTA